MGGCARRHINIARKRDPEGDMSGAKESTQQKGKPVFELSRRHEEHEGWACAQRNNQPCPFVSFVTFC